MSYKAIGFDYGGVIQGNPAFRFNDAVCKVLNLSKEKYSEIYFKNNYKRNLGGGSWESFWEEFVEEVGGTPEQAQEIIRISHEFHKGLNSDILELIRTLKERGYRLGLFSNNTQAGADRMREDGIDTYFDLFWVSIEVGYMKPDPEGFRKFFAALEVAPNESIFVDDSERSLSSSNEVGFTPILFRTNEGLMDDLTKLGITL